LFWQLWRHREYRQHLASHNRRAQSSAAASEAELAGASSAAPLAELDKHLAADRAEALRELAKLRNDYAINTLDDVFNQTKRLGECMGAIGPDEEGNKYLAGFLRHNQGIQLATHTIDDTEENRKWRLHAITYHWNLRHAHMNALDRWLRGKDAAAFFEEIEDRMAAVGPPADEGNLKTISTGPLRLKRTTKPQSV